MQYSDVVNSFFQSPNACLTWEGSPYQGREAIGNKLVVSMFVQIGVIIIYSERVSLQYEICIYNLFLAFLISVFMHLVHF